VASDDYANLQLQQDSEMQFENDSQDDHYTKYLQYMKDTYNIDLNVNDDAESEPILSASPYYVLHHYIAEVAPGQCLHSCLTTLSHTLLSLAHL